MSKRLLVVDDEIDLTSMLQFRLENRGFSVETCSNGGEALDKILDNPFDLVIMDYFMPLLKGDVVCQGIRSEERLKDLPVIIMTSFSNYTEDYFKEKGATEVIYKPLDMDALMEKIQLYLPEA